MEPKDFVIELIKKKIFIPFICFISQLFFKILNIEERHESFKETRRKFVCNILFNMLDHCSSKYYYYPLKALTEFFLEEDAERSLSKRLNAESLLTYKQSKEILGREILLKDFSKLAA